MNDLQDLVESQLELQVKISYSAHHDFLLRHGLAHCARVLDVGTGNGLFVHRLAEDHPQIQFAGIDKRKSCIESSEKYRRQNLTFSQADIFSKSPFEYSTFDGVLMRYFFLHVDHAKKILSLFKQKTRPATQLWIIDLDPSQCTCSPPHSAFSELLDVINEFCIKTSKESRGGQNMLKLLEECGYQDVIAESHSFSAASISPGDFSRYLKQEILCYAMMVGASSQDERIQRILNFLEAEVKTGKAHVHYGMILVSVKVGST